VVCRGWILGRCGAVGAFHPENDPRGSVSPEDKRILAELSPKLTEAATLSAAVGRSVLASGMMLEIEAYNRMVPTEDRREGIASFNEKRKPQFKGR